MVGTCRFWNIQIYILIVCNFCLSKHKYILHIIISQYALKPRFSYVNNLNSQKTKYLVRSEGKIFNRTRHQNIYTILNVNPKN